LLIGWLGIRRFREHSFFESLLPEPAVVADFSADRREFFEIRFLGRFSSIPTPRWRNG
jgi:hypothetical protein